MSDHVVLSVDRLVRLAPARDEAEASAASSSYSSPPPPSGGGGEAAAAEVEGNEAAEEEEPLIQMAECRICQDEDGVSSLESPCACSGSLKVRLLVVVYDCSLLLLLLLFRRSLCLGGVCVVGAHVFFRHSAGGVLRAAFLFALSTIHLRVCGTFLRRFLSLFKKLKRKELQHFLPSKGMGLSQFTAFI